AALAAETTQDGVDARERALRAQLEGLNALLVAVDRAPLASAVAAANVLLADATADRSRAATPAATLSAAVEVAATALRTPNLSQATLDTETATLTAAIAAYEEATATP
ncbi:hypothetical protein, partial [Leucobacter sp. M11]|uniref:hypothetical protein n=1 Tax=Leucobacter sp. M11 TaxID=2993565 RepID=UPI002D7FB2D6